MTFIKKGSVYFLIICMFNATVSGNTTDHNVSTILP